LEIALAVFAGLLIGSFLNVCIFRLPRDLSVVTPARSFCPGCETTIAWYDNIPLLSFALLKGKSRCCNEYIPIRYPIVELVTGIAFGVAVGMFGVTLVGLKFCIFAAIMIDLIATDFEERILPDEFTLGGTVIGMVLAWFVMLEADIGSVVLYFSGLNVSDPVASLLESAFGAAIASGILWLIAWTYEKIRHREGMGLGDVKMMALIGAFLGLRASIFIFFLSALVGSVLGMLFIWLAKKEAGSYELPFGSFLGATALVVGFWLR
jgi:leader peptidase (prepilin peptidase) / N-methyltransferase